MEQTAQQILDEVIEEIEKKYATEEQLKVISEIKLNNEEAKK